MRPKVGWSPTSSREENPVVVKPLTDIPSFDALGATLENASRLHRAGVTIVLSSFETHRARNAPARGRQRGFLGLDRDAALQAVTSTLARVGGLPIDRVARSRQGSRCRHLVRRPLRADDVRRACLHSRATQVPKETRQSELLQKVPHHHAVGTVVFRPRLYRIELWANPLTPCGCWKWCH